MRASAITYIERAGNPIQRAQLAAWQAQRPLTAEEQALLLERQRPDGGWAAFWSGDTSSVDATCYRLTQALASSISPANPQMRLGLDWLAQRQSASGSWEEDPELRDYAPPWARPGQQDAILYLTANAGWVLMRAGNTARAARAESFLRRQRTSEGRLPSFIQTHWLYAGLLLLLAQPTADGLLDMLATAIPTFSAGQIIWLGNCLLDSGLPAAHSLMQISAARLRELQRQDGSWLSDDGPRMTPQTTLEAVRFYLLLQGG